MVCEVGGSVQLVIHSGANSLDPISIFRFSPFFKGYHLFVFEGEDRGLAVELSPPPPLSLHVGVGSKMN